MTTTTATAPDPEPQERPKPLSRRELIARRQEKSSLWWIIHRLGSLNFALFLLATIALACAGATFAESGFNTKVAHAYIYKNPLFLLWLVALCVNLFAVTLTRWPWQKNHVGFIVTHYGIITLLVGAMIGMQTGYEGNVTLQKGASPLSRVVTSRSIIQLQSPADSGLYLMGFDAETAKPSAKRPAIFPVPGTDWKIVATDYSENLIKESNLVADPEGSPGVLLRLRSAAMDQTVDMPLLLRGGQPAEEDFFGLARISLLAELPDPAPAPDQETQMVFANFAPVVESGKAASGLEVRLSKDGEKVSLLAPDQAGTTYLRKEVMQQAIPFGNTAVVVEKYWPDFAIEDGQPLSKSETPNNPAILVRVLPEAAAAVDEKPSLSLALSEQGPAYQIGRGKSVSHSGLAPVGEPFALGWADWQAEVVQALPAARVASKTVAGPPTEEIGIPGFLAQLETGPESRGPAQWIESGQVTTLANGSNTVPIAYGLESKAVPFSIRLLDFDIPRDEGTDTPADFRATVEFRDAETGATKTGVARMNHPASFPGTFWANFTGINYKFSQAEWNPRDLNETTLQVLYDPGWMLKWMGSLGICIGIAIMFYWKPGSKKREKAA